MSNSKKKSLGRDPFDDEKVIAQSDSVKKFIKGRVAGPGAKEVTVHVKLTPANLKHLDSIRTQLVAAGRENVSRNDLIRIAITLLTAEDVN